MKIPEITNREKSKNIGIYYSSYSESWYFTGGSQVYLRSICDCGVLIDYRYVYIMGKLKKAKLLDENYPILCCRCFKGGIKNAS